MSRRTKQWTKKCRHRAVMADGEVRFYSTKGKAFVAEAHSRGLSVARYSQQKKPDRTMRFPESPRKCSLGESSYSFYDKVNSAEQRFLRFAASKGLRVLRNGWPDFFCENPDGGIAAVEVKNGIDDQLRPEQITCMKMLDESGIKTYIWNKSRTKAFDLPSLIYWKSYVNGRPEMDSGGKATGKAHRSAESDSSHQAHATPVSEDGRIPEVLENPRTIH